MAIKVTIPASEQFDESTSTFFTTKEQELALEHSLISISKWESKWHKPFYSETPKTSEETIDYLRCMTLTQNVDPKVYYAITAEVAEKINSYMEDPMTATTFRETTEPKSREIITSEIIYYWMVELGIPFDCAKWHINKLITLIRVCYIKQQPEKKMSKSEIYARNKQLNAARRKAHHTRG